MTRVRSLDQCVAWILGGAKSRENFRIGTEYERICVDTQGRPLPYDGEVSILAILEALADEFGWVRQHSQGNVIALRRDDASITLEPAGQLELSGAPLRHVTAMMAERDAHMYELDTVARRIGARFAYVGMNPIDTPRSAPKMPKPRYDHMRRWMPGVGSLGLDMMHLTCTVQANIDFEDEHHLADSFRLGYLMTPVIIALFANSPWHRGKDAAMASFRAHIWTDVDAARCVPGDWVYDPQSGVEEYVRWAADVPMYFVVPPASTGKEFARVPQGFTFANFIHEGFHGQFPTLLDWETHLGTLFPDVRLKRHLELRAADCCPPPMLAALPALVEGIFYDPEALAAALQIVRDGDTAVSRQALRQAACAEGLEGKDGNISLRDWAVDLLRVARAGLTRLIQRGAETDRALQALETVESIAAGDSPALHVLAREALTASPTLLSLVEPGGAMKD